MKKYIHRTWIMITAILSVVFTALFLPLASGEVGLLKAVTYNAIGLLVIWIVYFVRAYLFTILFSDKGDRSHSAEQD